MNEVYDAYPLTSKEVDGTLKTEFHEMMDHLETQLRVNIHQVGMETFANSIYYYCKFQKGSDDFWHILETALLKNKEGMTISHLSKCLLALVMNPRPIPKNLQRGIVDQIITKFDKAQSRDVFYTCMAIGKGHRKIEQDLISSDLYYAILLKCQDTSLLQEFDLY